MTLTRDEKYRLAEQDFVESITGDLQRRTDENHVTIFGFLVQGMVAILAGNRHISLVEPLNLPLDESEAALVKELWQHVIGRTAEFCTDASGKLDDVQFKWVLLRICERVFGSIQASILTERVRQSPHRV